MTEQPTQQPPMTVYGVPLADVFAEWERQYREDHDAFVARSEIEGWTTASYGDACVRTLLSIARDLSSWPFEDGAA